MVAGMPATETLPVVIACPNCGTRYQVPFATIGAKGRNVQCAHCGKSWQARAEAPQREKSRKALEEDVLDQKFAEEERRAKLGASERADDIAKSALPARSADHQRTLDEIKAAIAPRPGIGPIEALDAAAQKRQQQEFSRRQRSLASRLPVARFRRTARNLALAVAVLLCAGGIFARGAIVEQLPQLAGLYAAIGLGVNVVGLDFRDVRTLKSLQQGAEVLVVDGRIASVANHGARVPDIIVTLLDAKGQSLFEWSVTPMAGELQPGETVAFSTQLAKPPEGAVNVRLNFANAGAASTPIDAASSGQKDNNG